MNGLCLCFIFETPKQKLFIGTFVGNKLSVDKTEKKTPDGVYMEYITVVAVKCCFCKLSRDAGLEALSFSSVTSLYSLRLAAIPTVTGCCVSVKVEG